MNQLEIISNSANMSIEEILKYELSDLALISIEKISWKDIIKHKDKISHKVFLEKAKIPINDILSDKIIVSGIECKLSDLSAQQKLRYLLLIDYEYALKHITFSEENTKFAIIFAKFLTSNFFKKTFLLEYNNLIKAFEENKYVADFQKESFKEHILKSNIEVQTINNFPSII